eukprot:TRINITY_DN17956_c0_g1_i1.p1 TRINITY_DN17956_c0_g1~~TRINITY_DN17956_c0_g1_i1.p1  ORF type:complete len:264 (+),score=108.27 TRINITY_DN17956_c0_g1_i1:30-821(+)
MGGDGGVCANNRRFLPQSHMGEVKVEKSRNTVDKERWTTCQYSKEPLKPPVMADDVGLLYSGERVMTALSQREHIAPYIKGLKDFTKLELQVCKDKMDVYNVLKRGDDAGSIEDYLSLYECPITQLTTNGQNKFCFSRECGHVFSQRALLQMGGEHCPVCNKEGATVIDLVPDLNVVDELVEAAVKKKQEQAAEKKSKKEDKGEKKKKREREKGDVPQGKRKAAAAAVPEGANPDVWNSIFKKEGQGQKETFCNRGGMTGALK